jgi:hypothetical protein
MPPVPAVRAIVLGAPPEGQRKNAAVRPARTLVLLQPPISAGADRRAVSPGGGDLGVVQRVPRQRLRAFSELDRHVESHLERIEQ